MMLLKSLKRKTNTSGRFCRSPKINKSYTIICNLNTAHRKCKMILNSINSLLQQSLTKASVLIYNKSTAREVGISAETLARLVRKERANAVWLRETIRKLCTSNIKKGTWVKERMNTTREETWILCQLPKGNPKKVIIYKLSRMNSNLNYSNSKDNLSNNMKDKSHTIVRVVLQRALSSNLIFHKKLWTQYKRKAID
jgi:hypothetical protein